VRILKQRTVRQSLAAALFVISCAAILIAQEATTVGVTDTGAPIYRISGKVKPPQPTSTPDPDYPAQARGKHLRGTTVLWVTIGADGKVGDVKVARSFEPVLDQSAMDAVKKWKFRPAKLEGKPVAVQINIEINHRPPGEPLR
jgi:TonB family protein